MDLLSTFGTAEWICVAVGVASLTVIAWNVWPSPYERAQRQIKRKRRPSTKA